MNVVVVQEVDAPSGVTPISWVLLTSLPVQTFEDAWEIIGYYEFRWLIETNHAHYVQRFTFPQEDKSPYTGNPSIIGSGAMAPALPAMPA